MSTAVAGDDIVEALLASAADFLEGRHSTARCKGAVGEPRAVDAILWSEMADLGWISLTLPESLGGSGLTLAAAASLSELFGRMLVPEPLIAASVMPAALLGACAQRGGNLEVLSALAATLCNGERLLTVAWQERPQQVAPEAAATRLIGSTLQGQKVFVPVADENAIALVWADADGEPALVAVELQGAGVQRVVQAAGLSSVSTLRFDGASILGGAPLLRGVGALEALNAALLAGTVCTAAQLSGLAAGALQKTIDYVSGRVQFGRAIGSFQSIHHRCADLYIATQLSGASWREAARSTSPAAVAAAKARCGDSALKVAREAVQMHGAMGFTEEADIGLYLRAALHLSAWLGSPMLQRRQYMQTRMEVPNA